MPGVGGRHPKTPLLLDASQAQFAAHAFDHPETGSEARARKFLLQALCAISAACALVRGLCRDTQALTRLCSLRWLPYKPCVVAARRNIKHAAQHREWVVESQLPDHRVPRSDSLAKYAVAFFKMSRSIRNSAFSRLSRDTSACSSVTTR